VRGARGDEPCAVCSSLQKRGEIGHPPDIINHEQAAAISQGFFEPGSSRLLTGEASSLPAQEVDKVLDFADEIGRFIAQRHPEHAIRKGVLNLLVMAECQGQAGPR
jgi:hypothetical protein